MVINIVCYPGRALVNETCRPLLTYTSNLGYVITFGADIQHNMTIKYPESFLEYLRYEIFFLKKNKILNGDHILNKYIFYILNI
jgi:hypothetical protein